MLDFLKTIDIFNSAKRLLFIMLPVDYNPFMFAVLKKFPTIKLIFIFVLFNKYYCVPAITYSTATQIHLYYM